MGIKKRARGTAALALIVFTVSACATWEPRPVGPTSLQVEDGSRVRVTLRDGSESVWIDARMEGDAIVGVALEDRCEPVPGEVRTVCGYLPGPMSVPLTDVLGIAVERSNQARDTLVILGMVAGGFVVTLGVIILTSDCFPLC